MDIGSSALPVVARRPWNPWTYALAGIPTGRWWTLLKENDFAIDPAFGDRFVFHFLFSLVNTALGRREARLYGAAIEQTEVVEAPIFVVGHHRSGTTHLYNLLALDRAQFAFPNTFQVAFPFSFLSNERWLSKIVALMLLKRRPMDNMPLALPNPQEDEFALSLVSLCSPYLWFSFPKAYDRYAAYITFDDVPPVKTARWQKALAWFARKLTYKYRRRLLYKSPFHAARIRLILEVFPQARFIHVHRDPYAVFQSFRHMLATFPWYMCLQWPTEAFTEERIIAEYRAVHEAYFRDRATVPDDQLCEVRFEALEQDPVREVGRIYERFDLSGFGRVEAALRDYLDSIAGYRKNRYPQLSTALRNKLARAWRQGFEMWGYPA